MADEKKKSSRPVEDPARGAEPIGFDLGFGGLFKGLGNFVDLLSEMVESDESTLSRTGEIKFKGSDKLRGVYGFTVRTGLGGTPRVEHFGNIRQTEAGPVVVETREPLVDVVDEEDQILVVVELPGVAEDEIQVEIVGDDVLSLSTTGERKYAKEVLLPVPVETASLKRAYKNGVLEVRLSRVTGKT
mgnify:FL=1